jgi:hypothetical protein
MDLYQQFEEHACYNYWKLYWKSFDDTSVPHIADYYPYRKCCDALMNEIIEQDAGILLQRIFSEHFSTRESVVQASVIENCCDNDQKVSRQLIFEYPELDAGKYYAPAYGGISSEDIAMKDHLLRMIQLNRFDLLCIVLNTRMDHSNYLKMLFDSSNRFRTPKKSTITKDTPQSELFNQLKELHEQVSSMNQELEDKEMEYSSRIPSFHELLDSCFTARQPAKTANPAETMNYTIDYHLLDNIIAMLSVLSTHYVGPMSATGIVFSIVGIPTPTFDIVDDKYQNFKALMMNLLKSEYCNKTFLVKLIQMIIDHFHIDEKFDELYDLCMTSEYVKEFTTDDYDKILDTLINHTYFKFEHGCEFKERVFRHILPQCSNVKHEATYLLPDNRKYMSLLIELGCSKEQMNKIAYNNIVNNEYISEIDYPEIQYYLRHGITNYSEIITGLYDRVKNNYDIDTIDIVVKISGVIQTDFVSEFMYTESVNYINNNTESSDQYTSIYHLIVILTYHKNASTIMITS